MRKRSIDLNSDMGEGFGPWTIGDGVDDAIMPLISSANIATGFHAGDPNIMNRTVLLARERRLHRRPSRFRDLAGFGRRDLRESADALVHDIVYQLGRCANSPACTAAAAARETAWRAVHAGRARRGAVAPAGRDAA